VVTNNSDNQQPNFRFDLPDEVRLFNERNRQFLSLISKLNDAVYTVTSKRVSANRHGLTIFFLTRFCAKDFSEILLLSSNGYGFAAQQVLRSMFEKLVDASYLHKHPNEVDAFWEYFLVQLEKLGFESVAQKCDPDWRVIVDKFKTKTKKGNRTQTRWSPKSLVAMAKEVGMDADLSSSYYLPNLYVHNSAVEILFSLQQETDGTFTPVDSGTEEERNLADGACLLGYLLLLKALNLAVDHYGWKQDEPLIQDCVNDLDNWLKSRKP
jgi:hypothetical protein